MAAGAPGVCPQAAPTPNSAATSVPCHFARTIGLVSLKRANCAPWRSDPLLRAVASLVIGLEEGLARSEFTRKGACAENTSSAQKRGTLNDSNYRKHSSSDFPDHTHESKPIGRILAIPG
jgi:hypothetical protein